MLFIILCFYFLCIDIKSSSQKNLNVRGKQMILTREEFRHFATGTGGTFIYDLSKIRYTKFEPLMKSLEKYGPHSIHSLTFNIELKKAFPHADELKPLFDYSVATVVIKYFQRLVVCVKRILETSKILNEVVFDGIKISKHDMQKLSDFLTKPSSLRRIEFKNIPLDDDDVSIMFNNFGDKRIPNIVFTNNKLTDEVMDSMIKYIHRYCEKRGTSRIPKIQMVGNRFSEYALKQIQIASHLREESSESDSYYDYSSEINLSFHINAAESIIDAPKDNNGSKENVLSSSKNINEQTNSDDTPTSKIAATESSIKNIRDAQNDRLSKNTSLFNNKNHVKREKEVSFDLPNSSFGENDYSFKQIGDEKYASESNTMSISASNISSISKNYNSTESSLNTQNFKQENNDKNDFNNSNPQNIKCGNLFKNIFGPNNLKEPGDLPIDKLKAENQKLKLLISRYKTIIHEVQTNNALFIIGDGVYEVSEFMMAIEKRITNLHV